MDYHNRFTFAPMQLRGKPTVPLYVSGIPRLTAGAYLTRPFLASPLRQQGDSQPYRIVRTSIGPPPKRT
jgi:hypothetical protein